MRTPRFIITLLLAAISLTIDAGDISKLYKTHITVEGMIYFIMPQKMPRATTSKALKDLSYDVTSLVTTDSVTVLSTIITERPMTDTLLTITSGSKTVTVPFTYIFREHGKKGCVNRATFSMARADFRQLYDASGPFVIDFGSDYRFSPKKGKWEKQRQQILSILNMIELNK